MAVYLFCCARADLLPSNLEVEGLEEGSALLPHRYRDLAAVTSQVPLETFTGPEAEARLHDLAWLAPRALRHEHVVEQIARYSPVFPARFGSIFSSFDSLETLLARHHEVIRTFLERTADTEEWGFKGFVDRDRAREHLVNEEMAALPSEPSASPGARYMQERRLRMAADARVSRWLRETSVKVKEELSQRALETTERPLLSAGVAETPGDMVLNWAFLVPKSGVESFRAAAEGFRHALGSWGLAIEIAGPFPPYSFTPGLGEQP